MYVCGLSAIHSLLYIYQSSLGLADRYQVIDDLPNQNFTKTIDYANTDDLISKLRSDAFSYLDKIMNSI